MTDHLVILAPGLLGGSVARAARARGAAGHITLWARRPEVRPALRGQPWCDTVAETPEEAVRTARLVVLAAPVEKIVDLARQIAPHLPAGAIVTDVGSVKARLVHECNRARRPGTHFIGAHPMAGSEKTGWENATPTLFEGRVCFVTPQPDDDPSAVAAVQAFWAGLGARVVTLAAAEHDRIVAHISHLPQALATTLATLLAGRDPAWRDLAGGGLRDTTRIAASDPAMWTEIFQQNRDEVLAALQAYETELAGLRTAIANREWPEVHARLEHGQGWRQGLKP